MIDVNVTGRQLLLDILIGLDLQHKISSQSSSEDSGGENLTSASIGALSDMAMGFSSAMEGPGGFHPSSLFGFLLSCCLGFLSACCSLFIFLEFAWKGNDRMGANGVKAGILRLYSTRPHAEGSAVAFPSCLSQSNAAFGALLLSHSGYQATLMFVAQRLNWDPIFNLPGEAARWALTHYPVDIATSDAKTHRI